MSEKSQSIQPNVKFIAYKTPKDVWFRTHLLVPLLILSGLIAIYLSVMINRLALIGFMVIIALFFIRPGSEVYHMRPLSLWQRTFLILRDLGQLILVFSGIILVFLVTIISKSITLSLLLLFLFFILIDRLEIRRIAIQATFWNKPNSGSKQV